MCTQEVRQSGVQRVARADLGDIRFPEAHPDIFLWTARHWRGNDAVANRVSITGRGRDASPPRYASVNGSKATYSPKFFGCPHRLPASEWIGPQVRRILLV